MGISRLPLHAHSVEVVQHILGNACAHLEIAPPGIAPEDDDRELFVAAWCLDPKLIPAERTIFIPEPRPLVPGQALYVQADDVILNRLPGLRYVVWLRVVEIQDWSTPPPSEDDGGPFGHGDNDDDSDVSNQNRRHSGLGDGGDLPRQHGPRSTRSVGAGDAAPHLRVHRGPTFMSRSSILVGSVPCPFFNTECRPRPGPVSGVRSASSLHVPELKDGNGKADNVVQVSVENPIGTAMPEDELDTMRVVLSLNRNLEAVVEHSLPADLSLLEAVITAEAHTATATTSPATTATTAEIVATDANSLLATEIDGSMVGLIVRTETEPTRDFDPMLLDEAIARPPVSAAIKLDVALIDDVVMNLDRSEVAADSFIFVQLHDDLSLVVGYANVRHAVVDDAALLTIPCANDAGNERIWDPIPELMAGPTVVADSASRIESEPMPTSIPTAEQEPAPNNAGELQYDTHAVPVTPPEGGNEAEPASPSALIASFVDRITTPIPEPIIKTPRIRVPRRRVQPETLRRSIRWHRRPRAGYTTPSSKLRGCF